MSLIIKGGSGSSSHDFKLTDDKTERRSDSEIGRKPSKTADVEVNVGGGASAVEARRRSILAVSISRNSFAVKEGVSVEREDRPRSPETDDHRRLGFFTFRETSFSQ